MKSKMLPIALILFFTALIPLDRFFLKKNHSFCLHYIQTPMVPNPSWEINTAFPKEVLSQPFFYIGKGSQTFVFESQDKQWVLKFYKFPSHMRLISWLKHPFAYTTDPRRISIKDHNIKRFLMSYSSYYFAHTLIPEETAVTYVHLNPTNHLRQAVTLYDRLGAKYRVSLDATGYLLQRKAQKIFPVLDQAMSQGDLTFGKHVVDELIRTIVARCQAGLTDLDAMLHNNYGWLDGRAIHIDVGRLIPDASVKEPAAYQKEVIRITQLLSDYLGANYPELYNYYKSKINSLL